MFWSALANNEEILENNTFSVYAFLSMFSEGLNLAAITITLYRNIRFVVKNGYNEDALKVFPFLGMVIMASIFVSVLLQDRSF